MKTYRLLLFFFIVGIVADARASRKCFPSKDRDKSISGDCDEISADFINRCVSTFFRPRPITGDLTYRNSNTFYQRFRGDASCTFFTLDSTFLYQQNRKATRIGRGFLGENPLTFAEQCAPVNSLHLGLGSLQPEGFCSTLRLSPKRKVFAWLPQFIFNLGYFCPGAWADAAFAVVHANNRECPFEQITTPGEIGDLTSVTEALDALDTFPVDRKHTGIDDVVLRLGYRISYCEDDIISLYVLGSIPTGKQFDNTRWFNPLVGSKNGGVGFGVMFNSTLWFSEYSHSECLIMSEFKYKFLFKNHEERIFDLKNGRLSRFLLATPRDNPRNPSSATPFLRHCAKIEPKHTLEWWIALHYQWCSWGFEAGYNLWWRDRETVTAKNFDFNEHGLYDLTRCEDRTSNSRACIADPFGEGTPDTEFVTLTSDRVLIKSAAAREALSHTFSGTIAYNAVWCNYPFSIALGARYELAGSKRHTSTLENWGAFGKLSISC